MGCGDKELPGGAVSSPGAASASELSVAECEKLIKAAESGAGFEKARKALDKLIQEKPSSLAWRTKCWFYYKLFTDAERRANVSLQLQHLPVAAASALAAAKTEPPCALALLAHAHTSHFMAAKLSDEAKRAGLPPPQEAEEYLQQWKLAVPRLKRSAKNGLGDSQLLTMDLVALKLDPRKPSNVATVDVKLKEFAREESQKLAEQEARDKRRIKAPNAQEAYEALTGGDATDQSGPAAGGASREERGARGAQKAPLELSLAFEDALSDDDDELDRISGSRRGPGARSAVAELTPAAHGGGRAKDAKDVRAERARATELAQHEKDVERVLGFWRARVAETSVEEATRTLLQVPADELISAAARSNSPKEQSLLQAIVDGKQPPSSWGAVDLQTNSRAELWAQLPLAMGLPHRLGGHLMPLWDDLAAFEPLDSLTEPVQLEMPQHVYNWKELWVGDEDEAQMHAACASLLEHHPGETGTAQLAQTIFDARLWLLTGDTARARRLDEILAPLQDFGKLSADRQQELVDRLRDHARPLVLEPSPVSLTHLGACCELSCIKPPCDTRGSDCAGPSHAPFPPCSVRHAELPGGGMTTVLVHDSDVELDIRAPSFLEPGQRPALVPHSIRAIKPKVCAALALALERGWPSWDAMTEDGMPPAGLAWSELYDSSHTFAAANEATQEQMRTVACSDMLCALHILCENKQLPTRIVRDLKRFLAQRLGRPAADEPLRLSLPRLELADLLAVVRYVRSHWDANVVHTQQWQEQLSRLLGEPPTAFERRTQEDGSVAFHPSVALFGSCPQEGDCAPGAENVLRWIFAQDAELSRWGLLPPESAASAVRARASSLSRSNKLQLALRKTMQDLDELLKQKDVIIELTFKLLFQRYQLLSSPLGSRLRTSGTYPRPTASAGVLKLQFVSFEASRILMENQIRILATATVGEPQTLCALIERMNREKRTHKLVTAYNAALTDWHAQMEPFEARMQTLQHGMVGRHNAHVGVTNAVGAILQQIELRGSILLDSHQQRLYDDVAREASQRQFGLAACAELQAEVQYLDDRLESLGYQLYALLQKLCICLGRGPDQRSAVLQPVLKLLRERLLRATFAHEDVVAERAALASEEVAAETQRQAEAEKAAAEVTHLKSVAKRDKKKTAEARKKEAAAADAAEQQARLDAEAAVKKAEEDAQEAARAAEKEEQKRLADAARAAALEARAREVAEEVEAQRIATEAEAAAERVKAAQRAREQQEERATEQRLRELELKEAALEQESLSSLGASDAPVRNAPRAYRPPSVAGAPAAQPSALLPWMSAVPAAASGAALSPWPAALSAPTSYLPPAPFSYLPPAAPAAARAPPAAAQPAASGAGLSNAAGEYNCFLNSIVQSLFRLSCFKQHLLKSTVPDAPAGSVLVLDVAVVNGLQQLFRALYGGAQLQREAGGPSASGHPVMAPTGLRLALAALLGAGGEGEGLLNEMADAVEILTQMYECFQRVSSHFRHGVQSPVSTMFILAVQERVVCAECGVSSHALTYDTFFHLVHSTALREERRRQGGGSLEDVLAGLMGSDTKGCDRDLRGCGRQMPVTFQLMRLPQVFTISLAWETAQASEVEVAETMQALSEVLHPSRVYRGGEQAEEPPRYELRALVCYYGSHYACFVRTEEAASQSRTWTRFDDTAVTLVGGWEALCSACSRGHLQPTVLFYERC